MNIYKQIFKVIKKYDTIVIARHIGADPDALGSQFALKEIILKTFPNKKVYAVGNPASRFKFFRRLRGKLYGQNRQRTHRRQHFGTLDSPAGSIVTRNRTAHENFCGEFKLCYRDDFCRRDVCQPKIFSARR